MIEIKMPDWGRASDLITEDNPFVVVSMHFQRKIEGQIWVDKLENPTSAIAAFPRDAYAVGDLLTPSSQLILSKLSTSLPETPGLRAALQAAWGSFAVTSAILHQHTHMSSTPQIAAGYEIEAITPENVSKVQAFWHKEYPTGTIGDFIDITDFLHQGFGACAIHSESGLCVAACAAISVSRERCDFGLDTDPAHEGKGLATACSYSAVKQALKRGKRPIWVTEHDNYASQRVAEKIGFIKAREFEIYKRLKLHGSA